MGGAACGDPGRAPEAQPRQGPGPGHGRRRLPGSAGAGQRCRLLDAHPGAAQAGGRAAGRRRCGDRFSRPARLADRGSQPFYRVLGGRALNLAIQAVALPGLWDTQCGFKLFRGDLARDVFGHLHTDGFAYDVEVLWRARRAGCEVVEVPVVWRHIEDSRVSPFRHSFQILRDVLAMRLRR